MEFILLLGKEILAVPVCALIEAPFITVAARFTKTAPVSFKAAAMLALITGAVTLAISLVLYPLYSLVGNGAAEALSLALGLAAAVWLFGYFLRNDAGNSVGIVRGFVVFALHLLMIFGVLLLVGIVAALIHFAVS